MNNSELLNRIHIDPAIMVGKPVIKNTRLTVEFIVGLLAKGQSIEEVLAEYEGLEKEDILACLEFASDVLKDTTFQPLDAKAG